MFLISHPKHAYMQLNMLCKSEKTFLSVSYVKKNCFDEIFNMDLYLPIKSFVNVSFIKLFE